MKHLTVEEEDGAESLILGGGGHVALYGQVGEKGFDPSTGSGQRFRRAHILGMAFVMEKDVALDPVRVGLFGADGIVLEADDVAYTIQEFFWALFHFAASFQKFSLGEIGKKRYTYFVL